MLFFIQGKLKYSLNKPIYLPQKLDTNSMLIFCLEFLHYHPIMEIPKPKRAASGVDSLVLGGAFGRATRTSHLNEAG